MMPRVVAFDLDGTLLAHDAQHAPDYEDPASLLERTWVDEDAAWLVREWDRTCGIPIRYVSARPEHARAVTTQQLLDARLPVERLALVLRDRPWAGWPVYVDRKAAALRVLGADLYVGDLDHDAAAAARAGVRFLPAPKWRELSLSLREHARPVAPSQTARVTTALRPNPAGAQDAASLLRGGA